MTDRGSCRRERGPSCNRAPPLEVMVSRGAFWLMANSAAVSSPAPTAVPMEPPMKEKLKAATTRGSPSMKPCATARASSEV